MIDRTQDVLPQLQSLFPSIYDVYNENTVIYALLSVYADKIKSKINIIDRLNAMIGIQSTYNEDLEYRWGNILGVYKNVSESYDNYRSRLILAYVSLIGGTVEAIQYAIASVLSVSDYDNINNYIKVYDAWKYNGPFDISDMVSDGRITQEYGDIICSIDIACNESAIVNRDDIINVINTVKASGIVPQLLFLHTVIDKAKLSATDEVSNMIATHTEENISFLLYDVPDEEESDISSVFNRGIFGKSVFGYSIKEKDTFTDKIIYIGGK